MEISLTVLLVSALTLAVGHTAAGPDHYLPFIVLARSEGWTLRRTLLWTTLCGLGHVLSSMVIGAIGIAVGWSLVGMTGFEGSRGELASYVLMGFGGLYMIWGIWRARRGHVHAHVHLDGTAHVHGHDHVEDEVQAEDQEEDVGSDHDEGPHEEHDHVREHRRTLWALFLVFVLGPCEPLIPLLMAPASEHSVGGIVAVSAVFGLATVATMIAIVTAGFFGLRLLRLGRLERWLHALSGAAILASGAAIKLLGL